jgi:hypothetical protein
LFLTSESTDKVKGNWDNCIDLIINVEKTMNDWIKRPDENEEVQVTMTRKELCTVIHCVSMYVLKASFTTDTSDMDASIAKAAEREKEKDKKRIPILEEAGTKMMKVAWPDG